ncbi:MAG: ABC transporter ATP-binding protein [Muribaculaceae bacterium]|nr:ABC transporter ATP-binding protein [Muribaculaceae bacterium]
MKRNETIKIIGLDTGYSDRKHTTVITRDIDASLYSRELTCLLGPNGAGKSTLLKTLTAFLPPLKGDILIEGRALNAYSESDLAKVIGVVLTERLNLNNMSVNELVGMGRSPYTGFWGHMSADDSRIVEESIALVGIEGLRGRMVQTLSDGERQKVMIAKALAQETPVIFLDEPTAFLDYPSKVEIMQLLQTLSRERDKTVFLSTHDLELALQIADKVWLLDKTHGVTIGTPEDLALKGEMTKYFHREGVTFDIESGLFKIDHKLTHSITLEGKGPVANMVRKALARHGVAVTETDQDNRIKADDSGIRLNGSIYPDIDSLLDVVDSLYAHR